MSVAGGCLCGAVRFAARGAPITGRQCWCRLCQYLAAGSATSNAFVPTDGFAIEGEVRWYASEADSGSLIERGFCPTCGTPLFSRAPARPYVIAVRIGALDDPELMPPQSIIWTSAAPSWACLDPALPQVERQPPPVPPPA